MSTATSPTQVLGHGAAGFVRFHLGEFTTGREHLARALVLYDLAHRASYSEVLPNDALVQLRSHSSYLLTCLGHLEGIAPA